MEADGNLEQLLGLQRNPHISAFCGLKIPAGIPGQVVRREHIKAHDLCLEVSGSPGLSQGPLARVPWLIPRGGCRKIEEQGDICCFHGICLMDFVISWRKILMGVRDFLDLGIFLSYSTSQSMAGHTHPCVLVIQAAVQIIIGYVAYK